MFDTPGSGLIDSVRKAPSHKTLERILSTIIQSLFAGPDEALTRDGYLAIAGEATKVTQGGTPEGLDKSREATVVLVQHLRRKYAGKTLSPALKKTPEEALSDGALPSEQGAGDSSETSKDILLRIFSRSVKRPFDALSAKPPAEPIGASGKLPFLLSPVFAEHFIGILEKEFFTLLLQYFRGVMVQADNLPADQREEFILSKLEGRKQQTFLKESWQGAWKDLMDIKKLPKKPEASTGGMLKKMIKKIDSRQSTGARELTPEQWETKKTEIEAGNKKAKKIWKEICRESDDYLPPEDTDKTLLRDMFGRSPSGLEKQITALHQIVTQGGSVPAFEIYIKSRNVDLAFLAATFRHPDLFLKAPKVNEDNETGDDGDDIPKISFIKNVLKGYDDTLRRQSFPLLYRYVLSGLS